MAKKNVTRKRPSKPKPTNKPKGGQKVAYGGKGRKRKRKKS